MSELAALQTVIIILSIAIVGLLIIKTVHFMKTVRRKKVRYWFFFPRFNILKSQTPDSAKAKIQNILSGWLLVLLFVFAVLMWLKSPF